MATADLVQYRHTGELSDISIKINDQQSHLHKFPLYIKSEYFKQLELSQGQKLKEVSLDDFPGGMETFSTIADFCYNKQIDISLDNVAAIRSGAEYLKMSGTGNLMELSERYLNDVLISAKMSRSFSPIMELLVQCSTLGKACEEAKIGERCFETMLEIWTKQNDSKYSRYSQTAVIPDKILRLPLNWFLRLIESCTKSDAQLRPLADIVHRYLQRIFKRKTVKTVHSDKNEIEPTKDKEIEEDTVTPTVDHSKCEDVADTDDLEVREENHPLQNNLVESQPEESNDVILQSVMNALPEETPLHEVVTVEFVQQAINIASENSLDCREALIKLAGKILHRFNSKDLKQLDSTLLCEIVENATQQGNSVPEVLSTVMDTYLSELAKRDKLPIDDFIQLVKTVPVEYRSNDDELYDIVEALLSPEKSVPEEKRREVIELIDLSRCNENTLQRALDKDLIPSKDLCQAAINLIARIRKDTISKTPASKQSRALRENNDALLESRYRASPSSYGRSGLKEMNPSCSYSSPTNGLNDYDYENPYSSTRRLQSDNPNYDHEENLHVELSRLNSTYELYFMERDRERQRERERERERIAQARRRSPFVYDRRF